MDKGTIDEVTESGKGIAVTSPQTSRRGAFVAPALLFVALLGGALFFGLLAMSGKYEKDVATNNAAVTDPSPSKALPAAKTIATTQPTRTPHATSDPSAGAPRAIGSHTPSAAPRANSASEDAREIAALPRKPVPGSTEAPVVGDDCNLAGAKARTATGLRVVCEASETGKENHWRVA